MKKTIISLIMILCMSGIVNAALLRTDSCTSTWYCTAYSQNDCGTRHCVDINLCDVDKPSELILCEQSVDTSVIPNGYFTINKDAIKITLEQEKVVQQIITLNSSIASEYELKINYPSSYTKGTDFITTSSSKKIIDQKGDFTIIIDTRNILSGTYVVPVIISNKNYSKNVLLIIDVIPKNNPKISINLDSQLITLNEDKEISMSLDANGADIKSGDKLTYELIDPNGNIIMEEEKSFETDNRERIVLPQVTEGRYTLSAKISTDSNTYVKSSTFTILPSEKYVKITSEKRKSWILVFGLIIGAGLIIFLIKSNMSYKPYSKRKYYKYYGNIGILRPSFGNSGYKISSFFSMFSGFKLHQSNSRKKEMNADKKIDLLKKSYNRGFITLKEYHDALRAEGIRVESSVVEEHHKEIESEKKEERMLKQTKQEKETEREHQKAKEEKERQQKEKERQQKEMEKVEAEVLKQEETLRKEIEHQKTLKEKQEKELKEKETEKNKEIEKLKTEIAQEQKEIEKLKAKEIREEFKSEAKSNIQNKIAERPSVSPMAHLLVKDVVKEKENIEVKRENLLDKRVGYDQSFGLNNGERLYCLRDLLEALPHIQEHVFNHHTKQGRNDFANWIGDVFKYYDIAEAVRDSDSKEEMIQILKDHA